jgi:phage terminase large subunit-like protein
VTIAPEQMSLAQQIALLDEEGREAALEGLDLDDLQYDWKFWRRPSQTFPSRAELSWWIALMMAGRGSGKTRTGTEWAHEKAMTMPGSRGLLVARTTADTRDVLVEGDSGLLQVGRPKERAHYEPSKRRVTWPNGSQATLFTAEEPEVLRGPQGHWALCDEIATWRQTPDAAGLTAWDHVRIAARLPWSHGADRQRSQILALTTPKRTPIMKKLLALVEENPAVILRTDTTAANAGNLDPEYLNMIYGLFGGTRMQRQELDGVMLEDVEGALWTQLMLDVDRIERLPYVPLAYVIAVDPSVAEEPTDECGIVVCACTTEQDLYRRQFYVVEDASVYGSPNVWASQVVLKAREYGAPIVAEVNQGGALVRGALQNIDPTIKVLDVRARYGKQTRAEPVSLAFEQHRGHLLGWWPELEAQLTSWVPTDRKSPDRLDAMVWGATALLIKPPPGLYLNPIRAHSVAPLRIPRRSPPSPIPNARGIRGRRLDRFGRPSPGWRMMPPR